uniref:DEP domain-containing protein n=1 Tax=Elaeophora elaphi TaxID=1147741 RepID=A0A0R3RVT3_9BILA
MDEILSRIQSTALTYERFYRIKKYFTESRILTSNESDAFEWIVNNMQTIYKNPVNASKKLRIAIGNRSVPIDFAVKALQPYVENHTIYMADVIKYFSCEGRNEITINELSQILKRLIKMNIKRVLYDNSDRIPSTAPLQNSSHTYKL